MKIKAKCIKAFGVAASVGLSAQLAEARITKVEILEQAAAFGGYSWPGVGPYEKIVGIAHGEVNPHDRRNRVIVDLENAPREPNGNVKYSFNFYILKPVDMQEPVRNRKEGARKMMYEPPNRGGKTWNALGRVSSGPGGANDPASIVDPAVLANAFLMPRGYTIAWSGWENDLAPLDSLTATAQFPVARNRDGTLITGPSYEYLVFGNSTSPAPLTYPAATLDKGQAKLTHRVHLDDVPTPIPAAAWEYTDATGTAIRFTGTHAFTTPDGRFRANDIYEFSYTAKDPTVNGLGFAAVRDWNAWLRYEKRDDDGKPNPLEGKIRRIYTEISSQPGRLLNDFRHLGFNEAEDGKKVFDGHMQWIAAGNGLNMNYRFSQTGRTERNRQNHLYIEARFPFANVKSFDPITRSVDSRYAECEKTQTCPLGVEIYSANEYWVKAASLHHTDPSGQFDLPDSPYTRNYLVSSMQHGTATSANGPGTPPAAGNCQQPQNPLSSNVVQRALFVALDEWATKKRQPPGSRVPKLRDGTLVAPLPQAAMGFPNIPGVTYTGLKTTRYHFDYGHGFYETGIATINPPLIVPIPGATLPSSPVTTYQDNPANGPIYPSYVPKTDRDGNEIAGVRLADVRVPLATYTGWALRRSPHNNDGCESSGQFIPFAATEAERGASGDPRESVAARYADFATYHKQVRGALNDLVQERFLLCEDAAAEETRLLQAGVARGVPKPPSPLPAASVLPACEPGKQAKHDDRGDEDDED